MKCLFLCLFGALFTLTLHLLRKFRKPLHGTRHAFIQKLVMKFIESITWNS